MDVKLTETYFVVTHVWVFYAVAVLAVVPLWPIFRKAGFPGVLSLLMFVPVVNLAVLYVVGFSRRRIPS
jgi:NADH:ubiquinone oxidoreductase subunit 3 (subunit A)